MRTIVPTFSHINLKQKKSKHLASQSSSDINHLEMVLESDAFRVNTYDELVKNVAQILHRYRNLTLFYRGVNRDYKINGRTTILPSIFRKGEDEKRLNLKDNFNLLDEKARELKKLFNEQEFRLAGTNMLNKYPEIAWSILQHYEICSTPLLDLTHSLHVACSFAFDKNEGDTGIVYVLGMPWLTDSISYNTYEELVNIRLLSVCPPQAQRPFFQEGYLAGPFPNYHLDDTNRVNQFDFGRRLIAKFEIPIKSKKFWGVGFKRIPSGKLYQDNDKVKKICKVLMPPVHLIN